MPRRPLWPFRRNRGAGGVDDVAALVAALRRQVTKRAAASPPQALLGEIAGAESRERVRLPIDPADKSRAWLGGYLAGHLQAWVIRTQGHLSGDLLIPLAAYAAFLVTPPAERHLKETPPMNLLKTHLLASVTVAERASFSVATELMAFEWLAEQLGVSSTPGLQRRFDEWRERRLARFPQLADTQKTDAAS